MSRRKVWATKYALTTGIKVCTFKERSENNPKRIYLSGMWGSVVEGKDGFFSEEEAYARAVEMVDRKLKAMDKQREKLLKLRADFATKANGADTSDKVEVRQ